MTKNILALCLSCAFLTPSHASTEFKRVSQFDFRTVSLIHNLSEYSETLKVLYQNEPSFGTGDLTKKIANIYLQDGNVVGDKIYEGDKPITIIGKDTHFDIITQGLSQKQCQSLFQHQEILSLGQERAISQMSVEFLKETGFEMKGLFSQDCQEGDNQLVFRFGPPVPFEDRKKVARIPDPEPSNNLDVQEKFMQETHNCFVAKGPNLTACLVNAQTNFQEGLTKHQQQEARREHGQKDLNKEKETAQDVARQIQSYTSSLRALYSGTATYGTSNMSSVLINGGVASPEDIAGSQLRAYDDKPVDAIGNNDRFHLFFSEIDQTSCTLVMEYIQHIPSITTAVMPMSYFEQRTTQTPADAVPDPKLCQYDINTLIVVSQ